MDSRIEDARIEASNQKQDGSFYIADLLIDLANEIEAQKAELIEAEERLRKHAAPLAYFLNKVFNGETPSQEEMRQAAEAYKLGICAAVVRLQSAEAMVKLRLSDSQLFDQK